MHYSCLGLAYGQNVEEVKRLATRFDRFQYHLASGSNEKWMVYDYALQYLDASGDSLTYFPPPCCAPIFLPGGRYLVTAARTTDSHCWISLWDLSVDDQHQDQLYSCADLVLSEHKITDRVSTVCLAIQNDLTAMGANIAISFTSSPLYVCHWIVKKVLNWSADST